MFRRFLLLACLAASGVRAAVTLPYLLADHMVLQRDLPVHIWGRADPGEAVEVEFRGEARRTSADRYGRWGVYLTPAAAGGPFEVSVRGTNTIVLRDVLVGDVWVASGQSNMEWPLHRVAAEPAAADKDMRLVRAMHRVSEYPLDNLVGQMWAPANGETASKFSAVAYYFARQLRDRLHVPVGLIQSAWGGTPVEAWTGTAALSSDAALMPIFAEWSRVLRQYAEELPAREAEMRAWQAEAARAKAGGREVPERPGRYAAPGGAWSPGGLYHAMIAPITAFPIRGVIWYQGENNATAERAPYYGRAFEAMIRDWRRAWSQGDFPFLFVQLANFKTAPDARWPEVREAQRHALALVNTAMAVAIDLGEPGNIHPARKREVGDRLALAARAVAYGEKVEYSGPLFRRAVSENGAVRVWFDHVGTGLVARGGPLAGFEVAGADGRFTAATAVIDGTTVVVRAPEIAAPVHVRYGWADNPACNLYNAEALAASPFRSE